MKVDWFQRHLIAHANFFEKTFSRDFIKTIKIHRVGIIKHPVD